MKLLPLTTFTPPSPTRAWSSTPHPTLPLLATPSSTSVRIYSLRSFTSHSVLEGGHKRSIRSVAWKPPLDSAPDSLCIVTGSFDATAGLWRRDEARVRQRLARQELEAEMEVDVAGHGNKGRSYNDDDDSEDNEDEDEEHDWEFSLVLEGHESEIKSVAFSSSGQFLATCSRDKSVWIWEEIGAEGEDEWETVAVLQEHEGDVKAVAWGLDDSLGMESGGGGEDILASASYDDTIRLWKEDVGEGEWNCVAVLKGHDSTVWGIDWEKRRPAKGGVVGVNGDIEEEGSGHRKPLRLISCSADETVKVWKRQSEAQERREGTGIPSTWREKTRDEEWIVDSTLPKVHDRAVYSVSWSQKTGRVVSTGSDSRIVVYEEREVAVNASDMDVDMEDITDADLKVTRKPLSTLQRQWHVLAVVELGHGPFEINHATFCSRFDGGRKEGDEEMIVTTGDEGAVKAWVIEE